MLRNTIPQSTLALIKLREGFRDRVYKDSRGFLTAGTGHLLTAEDQQHYGFGDVVPPEVLEAWLEHDCFNAYQAALSQAAELGVTNQRFIDVLTSVNFQLGVHWNTVKFPRTWSMMKHHEWDHAANALSVSGWAKQTPVRVADFQDALLHHTA